MPTNDALTAAIQRETTSIRDLNTSLEETLTTLDSLAGNLATLTNNMSNSNGLANIYTDIHLHNRRLNSTLQEIQADSSLTPGSRHTDTDRLLETQINALNAQVSSLKAQLQALEKKT